MLQSYVLHHTFENSIGYNDHMVQDATSISTMDNGVCIELLQGAQLSEQMQRKLGGLLGVINKACSSYKSGKDGEQRDDQLLKDVTTKFTIHASFVAERNLSIQHSSLCCAILRTDSFLNFSLGPSLAAERHSKDDQIIVQAQVSSRPLHNPSPVLSPNNTLPVVQDEHPCLDPGKTYPVTTQLNFTLSEIFASLERAELCTISCIRRPNDSGSPNHSTNTVKFQIRSLLLSDPAARRKQLNMSPIMI